MSTASNADAPCGRRSPAFGAAAQRQLLPSVLMTPELQRIAAPRPFTEFAADQLRVQSRLLRGARG